MLNRKTHEIDALGRGVYSSAEALRLINFSRGQGITRRSVSGQTISRWLNGYDYEVSGEKRHSAPLWRSDYANDDGAVQEISFRDLIELRFVKTFRDLGLSLPTIRDCFIRAVEEVNDERPFSTQKFRTDGKTIFICAGPAAAIQTHFAPEPSPYPQPRTYRANLPLPHGLEAVAFLRRSFDAPPSGAQFPQS
jgi:hypothetical protein